MKKVIGISLLVLALACHRKPVESTAALLISERVFCVARKARSVSGTSTEGDRKMTRTRSATIFTLITVVALSLALFGCRSTGTYGGNDNNGATATNNSSGSTYGTT